MTTSRRTFLTRSAVVAAAASIPGSLLLSSPSYAAQDPVPEKLRKSIREIQARNRRVLSGALSRNGWEMEKIADDHGHIYTRPVPGTPLAGVQVRMGDVETVLTHVIRRFHYEIDELRRGDVIGWRSPGTVRRTLAESNQASGTAVQIRPGFYPTGTRGGFFANQLVVIRDILAELDGVVRWGGDDRRPDEALFYVDVPPGDEQLTKLVARLRGWQEQPGKGAGGPVDVFRGERRRAAKELEKRQRQAA